MAELTFEQWLELLRNNAIREGRAWLHGDRYHTGREDALNEVLDELRRRRLMEKDKPQND